MHRLLLIISVSFFCLVILMVKSQAQATDLIDPSGGWNNENGSLSLMLSGDELSFSYSSVFGPAVHICDGAGVAYRAGENEFLYSYERGLVSFLVTENEIRMRLVSGILWFCGADWPGDVFNRQGYESMRQAQVVLTEAFLYEVMPSPPNKRLSRLAAGDIVQTLPIHHERSDEFILVRYNGPRSRNAGLLKKEALTFLK